MTYAYVFGPVASSRLGLSLGLDLLGRRICSMDCLYCEVGQTDVHTLERAPWVPAGVILDELAHWAASATTLPDHVTLGGSGEPCLNSDLAAIIAGCRRILPGIPVAVLTNATLLDRADVRADLCLADVVLPSLDSLVEREFRRINRTCEGVTAASVAAGIRTFAQEYTGRIWLEILLVEGINDSTENLDLLHHYVREIAPDRVDVTTLSRPGTWSGARPVSAATLTRWRDTLTPLCRKAGPAHDAGSAAAPHTSQAPRSKPHGKATGKPPESAAGFAAASTTTAIHAPASPDAATLENAILQTLRRRPQTAAQLALALTCPEKAVNAALDGLHLRGCIRHAEEAALSRDAAGEPFWTLGDTQSGH